MPSRIACTASGVERAMSVSSMRRMNCAAVMTRISPGKQRGAGAADVQITGGGGSETGADVMAGPKAEKAPFYADGTRLEIDLGRRDVV